MTRTAGYAFICFLLIAGATLGMWAFLAPASRKGVLVAAGVAYPVQVAAFGALLRLRHGGKGFLVAWIGGILARFGLVLVFAVVVVSNPVLPPVPTLLALVGFLFGMLLLEPVFLRDPASGENKTLTR